MKCFIAILLFPTILFSQVQTISNQKTFGTDYEDATTFKVIDGFIYSINRPASPGISQDKTIAGFGSKDGWFVKMDLSFNILNQDVYGGNGLDVGIDFEKCSNGDFLILFWSYSDVDGNKTVASFGSSDYWLIRVDSVGNILWQKTYGGSDKETASKIIKLNENRFVLFGTSRSSISGNKTVANYGTENGWAVYIDGQGNILNQFVYGGTQVDRLGGIKLNSDSTRLVYSLISNSPVSGNKTVSLKGFADTWVFTTDTLGNILSQVAYSNGPGITEVRDIEFNDNNEIFIAMDGLPGIVGDKIISGFGGPNYGDAWLVKLDVNLNELNQFVFGGTSEEILRSLTRDGSNIILCIESVSGIGGNKTESNFGQGDNWIVCIDPNGQILWQKTVGGLDQEDYFTLKKSNPNEYIVASYSFSGISGNKTVPFYVSGVADTWLYKLTTTLSIEENDKANLFSVSPNPFEDKISFSWNKETHDVQIQIFNASGQAIETIKSVNDNFYQWSANDLPSGVYFYTISSNKGVSQGKIVKR
jgi:hypothetical protein